MKTEEEVKLMIARIEGRVEGTNLNGGDSYADTQMVNALLWVVDEVEKI